jgi:OCT family organic cation transporter-like MFS transporter 4/5
MVGFSYDFNVGTPDHRCRLFDNDTYDHEPNTYKIFLKSLPLSATDYDKKCTMLNTNSSSTKKPCDQGWVFDMKKYGQTLSTELSLVCEKFHLRALTQNIYSIGAAGSLLTGLLSDRWGRRKTIYLLIIILIFALNTMQLFFYSPTQKLLVFTICRFFQGFAITFHSVILVLLSELTGPSRRVLAANTLAYSFALGQIILAIIARQLKDYKLTYWALNLYVLPFIFIYILIPESPRWLVQQGRIREARKVLERIFLINRRPLHDRLEFFYSRLPGDVIAAREAGQNTPTYLNVLKRLCRSKLMRKRCLLLIGVWTVALSVYLGFSSALPALTKRPHEFFIAGAVSEMIGLSVCHGLSSLVERRRLLIVFFVATALAAVLVPVTHNTEPYSKSI